MRRNVKEMGAWISQGIGRGNYSNLEPMGKIQMSKGKTIKWSTTLFVLCAQSLNSLRS